MAWQRNGSLAVVIAGFVTAGCGGGGGSDPPPGNMTTTVSKTSMASGDAQTGTAGQPLANPLQVVVSEGGDPAAGVTVSWTTTAAGGSMSPAAGGVTDANGVSSSAWLLGTVAGSQTASATVSGAVGSPVTFTATAGAGAAAALSKSGGDGQTAETGAPLALPVQARVTDAHGNGVAGTTVAWAVSGGTASSAAVTSGQDGVAAVNVTAGAIGPITITASADGLSGSPLTFNATAVAIVPPPASANVSVGNNSFRSNRNSTFNPAVDTVAVAGTVTWTWVGTGNVTHSVFSQGSPSFPSSQLQTGSGQNHSATFMTAGTYEYTCAAHPGQMTGRVVVR